jgi:predicted DNA-binding antitoxin AbrB/MazE fold protein
MSMNAITVEATYTKGLLKPAIRLNLTEGARVEVRVSELPLAGSEARPDTPSPFGSLRGILSQWPEAEVDSLDRDLRALRQQTHARLERLARES